jgi:hypothetical protein
VAGGDGSHTIPGTGTFFVGPDIAGITPGRYRCDEGEGGWWVRFTAPGGGRPVGNWPLPPGPAEVDLHVGDFAFETHVPTYWRRIGDTASSPGGPADPHPVADPALRPELDALVARHGAVHRMVPLSILLMCMLGVSAGGAWGLTLIPLAVIVLVARHLTDDVRRARALRLRRDRYLTPEDLDEEARALLGRVQGAVEAVQESQVNREGLLDRIENAVTLPLQEWEIAQVLARQARLRDQQREILAAGAGPEVEAAMRPLREKLELSVQAVTRRIEALERYAQRTRAADEAFRAQRHLDTLAELAAEYDELVAGSVREDLAVPAIDRLTEQSDELVRTLRSRPAEGCTEPPGIAP